MMRIHEIPLEERPREKLLKFKVEHLSTVELIAIILGSGTKEKPVLQLAQEILTCFGNLQAITDATVQELCQIKGLGKAKAVQLKAAFGLGYKLSQELLPKKNRIDSAADAYYLLKGQLENEKKEHLIALLLDAKGVVIHQETIAVGTLTQILVHPREVFYPAIRHKAASLILAHNHPSGDPTPSEEDYKLTHEISTIGKLMGIPLLDHIIIGKDQFSSVK